MDAVTVHANIVRNSVGGCGCGLNGKNIKTLVCRSYWSMRNTTSSALLISSAANRQHKPFIWLCIKLSTLNTNSFTVRKKLVYLATYQLTFHYSNLCCSQTKRRPLIVSSTENRPNSNPGNTCFCVLYMHLQCARQSRGCCFCFVVCAHYELRAADVAALLHRDMKVNQHRAAD